MNYKEIYDNISDGKYESKLPFPQYRPNLKDRANHEQEDKLQRDNYRIDDRRLAGVFKDDLKTYIESELLVKITDRQFNTIYNLAWDKGHSSGYGEVLSEVSDLLTVVCEFIKG